MLARLILTLLLAAFAMPAAAPAACHERPVAHAMAMAGAMDHQMPAREHEAVPPHGCIGCVPPSTWIAAPVAVSAGSEALTLIERATVLDIGTGIAPALPPPRGA